MPNTLNVIDWKIAMVSLRLRGGAIARQTDGAMSHGIWQLQGENGHGAGVAALQPARQWRLKSSSIVSHRRVRFSAPLFCKRLAMVR
jgi:hypothetical protein